ncbi:S41 family peptidase [bacterium]|nr:S41 family peptidase [bacterium]
MKRQFLIFILLVASIVFLNTFLEKYVLGNLVLNDNTLLNTKKVNAQKLFENSIETVKKNYIDKELNGQNLDEWKKRYDGKIQTDEDANVAINSVLETLDDPYSRYLDKETYAEQNSSINSKIIGIGVNIASIGGKTYIVNVLEGTPAEKAGLKNGDIIVKVDGEDVTGLKTSDVASRVRGEIDTVVKLSLLRDKRNLTKNITRKNIKIKNIKSKMVDDDIGYIEILSFIGATTYNEFLTALAETTTAKGLIIDLRGNSGGLLPNAVNMANLFINKGNIVSIVGRNGFKKQIKAQKTDYIIDKPVVLLIDEGSASASEIFSGALKDYNKAVLVGTKSFGKGLVQRIIPMPNETGMNLTIAKYLTPNDTDIHKKGIEPDLKVPVIKGKKDMQLEVAKNIINDLTR